MNFNELYQGVVAENEKKNVKIRKHPDLPHIISVHYTEKCVFNKNWNEITLQCRDLVMDVENEVILARPIQKFFNNWERNDMGVKLPEGDAEITIKEDGVRVTSFLLDGQVRFVSEGEFVGRVIGTANEIWRNHFKNVTIPTHLTLTFEVLDPFHRVIVPQNATRFVLVAAVDRFTGEDYTHQDLKALQTTLNQNAEGMEIGLIHKVDITIDEALAAIDTLPWDQEGYVIRIGDTRIKAKSRAYLRVFKTVHLMSKRQKLEKWMNNEFNELVQRTPVDFHDDLLKMKKEFDDLLLDVQEKVKTSFNKSPKTDRKTFALWVNENAKNIASLLFAKIDGKLNENTFRQFLYHEHKKSI